MILLVQYKRAEHEVITAGFSEDKLVAVVKANNGRYEKEVVYRRDTHAEWETMLDEFEVACVMHGFRQINRRWDSE